MSAVQLAHQLKPFGVRPRLFRDGAKSARGYSAEDFGDAFARYLPANPLHPSQLNADPGLLDISTRYASDAVTARDNGSNPYGTGFVTSVTGQDPDAERRAGSGGTSKDGAEVFEP